MMLKRSDPPHRTAGFTLIELLVVVGLIAIMAAVSLPAIGRFIRNYRIRGAVAQVAGELQRARATAIKKNVNLGVVLLVTRARRGANGEPAAYRVVVEDDALDTPRYQLPLVPYDDAFLDSAANADAVSREFTLPQGVEFATVPADCPASNQAPVNAAFNPNNYAVRFTNLGATCAPATSTPACPLVNPARDNTLMTGVAAGMVLCVREVNTGLSRTLVVLPSGQVVTAQ